MLMFLMILRIAKAIIKPTPAPMLNTKAVLVTEIPAPLTWSAKIVTSGSAIVAHIPKATANTTNITNFDALLTELTINSPIGIMVESIPVKKNVSPTVTSNNAKTKFTRV